MPVLLSHSAAAKTLDYTHLLDDKKGRSYDAGDSSTKGNSYRIAFTMVVGGVTVILYTLLLVGKLTSWKMGEKVQEIMYGLVAAMQFALGVQLAIEQSRQIDPNGPNATPITIYSTFP